MEPINNIIISNVGSSYPNKDDKPDFYWEKLKDDQGRVYSGQAFSYMDLLTQYSNIKKPELSFDKWLEAYYMPGPTVKFIDRP